MVTEDKTHRGQETLQETHQLIQHHKRRIIKHKSKCPLLPMHGFYVLRVFPESDFTALAEKPRLSAAFIKLNALTPFYPVSTLSRSNSSGILRPCSFAMVARQAAAL